VFYETLLRQRPDSAMAQDWCVRFGVLHHDEAGRLNKIVMNRKRKGGSSGSTPQKASSSAAAAAASSAGDRMKKKKKKAKIMSEDGYDPEMQASSGDAIGRSAL
jgi:Zn-finger nucleic acid-binding protein